MTTDLVTLPRAAIEVAIARLERIRHTTFEERMGAAETLRAHLAAPTAEQNTSSQYDCCLVCANKIGAKHERAMCPAKHAMGAKVNLGDCVPTAEPQAVQGVPEGLYASIMGMALPNPDTYNYNKGEPYYMHSPSQLVKFRKDAAELALAASPAPPAMPVSQPESVATIDVEDGCVIKNKFHASELPDGRHELYASKPAMVVEPVVQGWLNTEVDLIVTAKNFEIWKSLSNDPAQKDCIPLGRIVPEVPRKHLTEGHVDEVVERVLGRIMCAKDAEFAKEIVAKFCKLNDITDTGSGE